MSRLFRTKSDIELYLGSNSDKNCCPVFLHGGGGYYFCIKVTSGKKDAAKKYFKKEWVIYTAWSLFYFALILFALRDEVFVWKDYFLQCIRNYFVFGSYYHLWYIPAMFFSAGLFYLAYKWNKVSILSGCACVLYIIGCFGTAYYNVFINVPVIGSLLKWTYFAQFIRFLCRGVPFFMLGVEINLQSTCSLGCFFRKDESGKRVLWICSVIVVALFILEQFVIYHFELMESPVDTFMLMPFVGLLLIILLRNPMPDARQIGRICSCCAGFVYFSHPAIILVLQKIFEKFEMSHFLSPTIQFVITTILGTAGGIVLLLIKQRKTAKQR